MRLGIGLSIDQMPVSVGGGTPPIPSTNRMIVAGGASNSTAAGVISPPDSDYVYGGKALLWDGAAWTPYVPGSNSLGTSSGAVLGTGATGAAWGPEAEFLRRWHAEYPGDTLYIYKQSYGGTSFGQVGTTDWNVNSTNKLYRQLLDGVAAAKAAAPSDTVVSAFLFTSGGNDTATEAIANAFEANMTAFVSGCRTAFLGNAPIIFERIRTGVPEHQPWSPIVQEAMRRIGQGDPNAIAVWNDDQGTSQHIGNSGIRVMGGRYYQAYRGVLAPSIISSPSTSVDENTALTYPLRSLSYGTTWSVVGGADQTRFAISGQNLTMTAKDYESPVDANADNMYQVTVRATDPRGNTADQSITVSVNNLAEGSIYDPDADALFQRHTIQPSESRKTAMNNLIIALKNGGVWDRLESLFVPISASSEGDSLLDWRRTRKATKTASVNWSAGGWTSTSTDSEVVTGVDTTAMNVSGYTSSNSWIACGLVGFTPASTAYVYAIGNHWMTVPSATTVAIRQGASLSDTITVASPSGRWTMNRAVSSTWTYSQNGAARTPVSRGSAASTGTLSMFKRPSTSNTGIGTVQYHAVGLALTDAQDQAFSSAMATYLSS